MNTQSKKFISPGGWFSLEYPNRWNEFEDTEESFLFYNPEKWQGNFRISAYKANPQKKDYMSYGKSCIENELKQNPSAVLEKINQWDCAYSKETFVEDGKYYTTHIWITGKDNIAFECSFTVPKGTDPEEGKRIIETLEARKEGKNYPVETIPIRILEICMVNEAYEWVASTIKKQLKKDFTGTEKDLPKMQQVMDKLISDACQKENWQFFGLAFGAILVNEINGMNWVTVIDNCKEYPALRFEESELIIRPLQLIEGKIKKGQSCLLKEEFENIKREVEKIIDTE